MFKSNRQKNISIIVFGIYLFLLIWLILFKFRTSISGLPYIKNINLIPYSQSMIINGKLNMREIIYNVLVFIPFGVYIELLMVEKPVLFKVGLGFLLSLILEMSQFVLAIGASDITDIIGNTLGCILGVVGCLILMRLFKNKYKLITIVNTIGISVEIIAITMLTVAITANM